MFFMVMAGAIARGTAVEEVFYGRCQFIPNISGFFNPRLHMKSH